MLVEELKLASNKIYNFNKWHAGKSYCHNSVEEISDWLCSPLFKADIVKFNWMYEVKKMIELTCMSWRLSLLQHWRTFSSSCRFPSLELGQKFYSCAVEWDWTLAPVELSQIQLEAKNILLNFGTFGFQNDIIALSARAPAGRLTFLGFWLWTYWSTFASWAALIYEHCLCINILLMKT